MRKFKPTNPMLIHITPKRLYTHNIKTLIHATSNIFSHFLLSKPKGTSNKFRPRNIFVPMILILPYKQKRTSNKFRPRNIFIPMIPILHQNQKGTSNKFASKIFKPKKFLKTKGTSNKSTL